MLDRTRLEVFLGLLLDVGIVADDPFCSTTGCLVALASSDGLSARFPLLE